MRQEKVFAHDLDVKEMNEGFERLVLSDTEIVKPILKERFLKDYILGIGDADEAFSIYCKAFATDKSEPARMIVLKPNSSDSYDELFYIKNTAERYIGENRIIMSTSMQDCVMLITDSSIGSDEMDELLHHVAYVVRECYELDIISVYSGIIMMSDLPETFRRLSSCTEYSFYSEGTKVMCENMIRIGAEPVTVTPQYTGIEEAVTGGDEKKTSILLEEFFTELERCMPTPAVAKTYCLELYVCIIRCCAVEKIEVYMKGIVSIQVSKSFSEIKKFINSKAMEIAHANTPKTVNIYSSLIKDTIRIIDENIGNEKLSLRWIAGTILYTNVDYLGKIFKKETGMNFSHYVMEKRMELAKELIMGGKKDRIYEVAEKVGYGSNSQYFSQVFKKYTGISPLEYKEITRTSTKKRYDSKKAGTAL
ncbi:MAG: helix-turn-helix transcriptional regulator [Candidatus Ornithomonoglobus sp.]